MKRGRILAVPSHQTMLDRQRRLAGAWPITQAKSHTPAGDVFRLRDRRIQPAFRRVCRGDLLREEMSTNSAGCIRVTARPPLWKAERRYLISRLFVDHSSKSGLTCKRGKARYWQQYRSDQAKVWEFDVIYAGALNPNQEPRPESGSNSCSWRLLPLRSAFC